MSASRSGVCNGGKEGNVANTSKQFLSWEQAELTAIGSGAFESAVPVNGPIHCGGKKGKVENLWQEFFLDPTQWWDHRLDKFNSRFPDFVHTKTGKGLWLDSKWIPPWVEQNLAILPPGTMQLSTYSWNQKLLQSSQAGHYGKTIELFQQMQQDGMTTDKFTFLPVLKACVRLGLLEYGRHIHKMMHPGIEADVYVGSSLVDMYAKCGSIEEAENVFNEMPRKNVVVWTAMIMGYVKCGKGQQALDVYGQMQKENVDPNPKTFVAVLNACSFVEALEEGRSVHEQIIQKGYEANVYLQNSLVDMYGKCGSIEDAKRVFKQMSTRDVVTWTAMILGYVKCGEGQQALELYQQMQQEHVNPDSITFVAVLNACACIGALEEGRDVHKSIIQAGYDASVFVQCSLIDMYAKCGSMKEAEILFKKMPKRNMVSWTAMILGYVKCGEGQKALKLYQQMKQDRVDPDPVAFVAVLNACASVAALEEGKGVHEAIIQKGYEADTFVQCSLVDMYGKCGSIRDAVEVFKRMHKRDAVAWTVMILGCVKCSDGQQALELYQQMQQHHVDPTPMTFVVVLNACASVAALQEGRSVHEAIIQRGYETNHFVQSSLIDMYGKCGSIEEAEKVFKQMHKRDVVAWNAMLAAYSKHGYAKEALEHFKQMSAVVEMNIVTFICLLTACNHGGLVDDALKYFKLMSTSYKISPTVDHYACVVDLLGRAGRLREAEDLIMSMPMNPNAVMWLSLLGACRVHVNVEVGERCAKQLLELEPQNSAGYVMLADIYVAAGKWESGARAHEERLHKGLKKKPECTWIEVNNEVHSFVVGDSEHPQIMDIHTELKRLAVQMKDAGFGQDTRFVLYCRSDEERKEFLHSGKLAVAFGLISTIPGTPLRMFKNLQMCRDCHTATKFMAQIVGRAIIVKDAKQVHHFKDGLCSCKDCW